MVFKTITIKNTVYMHLMKEKKPDESFSTLFERLLEKTHSLEKFYGAWTLTKAEEDKQDLAMKKFRSEFNEEFKKHESTR